MMIKTTRELQPGDVIFVSGKRTTIEMVSPGTTYQIRYSSGGGFFLPGTQWLVEEPLDDIIKQAEQIAISGDE